MQKSNNFKYKTGVDDFTAEVQSRAISLRIICMTAGNNADEAQHVGTAIAASYGAEFTGKQTTCFNRFCCGQVQD